MFGIVLHIFFKYCSAQKCVISLSCQTSVVMQLCVHLTYVELQMLYSNILIVRVLVQTEAYVDSGSVCVT